MKLSKPPNRREKSTDKVFDIVQLIPQGKVATYGTIAQLIGMKNPRLVGQILHKNTDPINIPCHRVVFADGSLSLNYVFGGKSKQKQKLYQERVAFLPNGKVNLRQSLYSIKSFSSFLRETIWGAGMRYYLIPLRGVKRRSHPVVNRCSKTSCLPFPSPKKS